MNLHKKRNPLALIGLLSIIFISSVVFLAVFFLQKSSSELNLDARKAAMVDSGLAELNTYPFHQSTLKVKEEQKINLQLNSKTKSLKSIELIFEVIADKGLLDTSKIKFTGTIPDTLKVSKQEIIESLCEKNCFTVTLLLEQKDANSFFNTNDQMVTISQLSFTPQTEGSLKIKINQDSTAIETVNSTDILQKPSVLDFQYYVTDNGIDRAQCYYQYTNWGDCKNGWQTRSYSVQPDKCYWYKQETLGELSQACTDKSVVMANQNYFYLYSNDRCLNQPSDGKSLYVIWNADNYKNVTYIDVSSSPTFNDFYHKKVDGNIDQRNGSWLMVNGSGFTHATGSKGPLSIEPNQEYYFRLYSTDNNGQHIASVRYYITYCSGDQSLYKNCNDACGKDSDQSKTCAPGLTCHEGVCRNTSNPTNELCLATPGIRTSDLSCNQYCASNRDCASGLSCFWNRCRNPQNLDSSSCSVTSQTSSSVLSKGSSISKTYTDKSGKTVLLPSEAYDLVTYGCNQGCNNNRDCDANLRCYKGKCRLADDPESLSCVDESLVSSSSADQKQDIAVDTVDTGKVPSISPTPNDEKVNFLQNNFNNFLSNFSWQWLAVAGGILLVAITLIIISITKAKKDPWVANSTQAPPSLKTEEKDIKIPEDKPLEL